MSRWRTGPDLFASRRSRIKYDPKLLRLDESTPGTFDRATEAAVTADQGYSQRRRRSDDHIERRPGAGGVPVRDRW